MPVNELKDVNNIESGDLEPGQRLTIPPNARGSAKARNTGKENDAATEQKEDNDTKESGKSNQGVKEAADTTKSSDETAKETTSSKHPEKNKEEQVGQDSASQQSGEGSTNTTNNQDNTKSEARTDHNKPSNNKKKEAKPAGTTDKPADKSSREQQQRSDQQEEKVETTLHSVNPGETLYSIAQQYGTTVEKIKQINNLSANNLAVAQELKVPDNREDVPQQGNQLPEEPSDDAKTVIIHVVKEGQTLYSISQNYNTSVDEILQANDNLETTQIETGQKIKIPDKEGKKNQSQEDTRQNKSSDKKTHTVKPGETLYSISQEYNVSVKKIKEWNNLSSNNLEVGQELRIKK